jgi:enterobactin synthetase component D
LESSVASGAADFIYDIRHIEEISLPGVALRAAFNVAAYRDDLYPLLGVEFPGHLERAVAKRKAEFLCGRFLAGLALQRVAGYRAGVGIGEHRQPLWPANITGSITHTNDTAACLVSHNPASCIGIDIENIVSEQTARSIADSVICESERILLSQCQEAFPLCLTVVFSAKETLFKALYPRVGFYFDFNAALVTDIDLAQGSIVVQLTRDLGQVHHTGDSFEIRLMLEAGRVLSYLVTAVGQ